MPCVSPTSVLFSVSFRHRFGQKINGCEKQTEMVLAWELHEQGLSQVAIARRLGRNRETGRSWLRGIEFQGLPGFFVGQRRGLQKAASGSSGGCSGQGVDLADSRT